MEKLIEKGKQLINKRSTQIALAVAAAGLAAWEISHYIKLVRNTN